MHTLSDFVASVVSHLPPGLRTDFMSFGELLAPRQRCVTLNTLFSGTDGVVDALKDRLSPARCLPAFRVRMCFG